MKFSETPPALRKWQFDYINTRWRQLYELERVAGQTALQYLFLTNAGGAATTLAFIGAIGADKIVYSAKLSLACYVLGVILSGVGRARQFHYMSGLFKHWKNLVAGYFSDENTYEEMIAADDKKAVMSLFDYLISYASFGCFIFGSIVGFFALM